MHIYTIILNVGLKTVKLTWLVKPQVYNFYQFPLLFFKNYFKSVCMTRDSIS